MLTPSSLDSARPAEQTEPNPLEVFFDGRTQGAGIWKWRHYFDIYHSHFNRFRKRDDVVVLEIGVYSGGSLDMWQDYFSPSTQIYGIDIEYACRVYEREHVHILIGDQADRAFWRRSFADGTLPKPDIVIDDGGHTEEQQRITMEEVLPNLRPGGVYVCEDIHRRGNAFTSFATGFADGLNTFYSLPTDESNAERRIVVKTRGMQSSIHSVHFYPFILVIEKRNIMIAELTAPKHGTRWEPFLT